MNKFILILIFLCPSSVWAQRVFVTGSWNVSMSTPTEAGSDYTVSYVESADDQTKVTITHISLLLPTFTIRVRHTPAEPWPAGLVLKTKRTSGGEGLNLASLSGGVSYITLTNTDQIYFSLGGLISLTAVNNVAIQYRIEGISVLLPVKNYATTVTYTVSN